MKVSMSLATFLIYCPLLMSQEVGLPPYIDTTYSQNHQFELIVSGASGEDGWAGPQKISLQNVNGTTFWSKTSDGSGYMPIVSNRGDVTYCEGLNLSIFDENGSIKGTFTLPRRGYKPNFDITDIYLLQSFSPDAKYYYTMLGSRDSIWLLVLSDSAKEVHQELLDAFHPLQNDLQAYKDKVIAFDSHNWSDPEYKTRCCVFDKLGNLIWEYDQQAIGAASSRWIVKFDRQTGILKIIDGEKENTFDVNTLE